MPASAPGRRIRRAATAPYSAARGLNRDAIQDVGRCQKAGSRIGGSHLEPQLQQIGLESGHRALQRTTKLFDDALGGGERGVACGGIGKELAELLDQRVPVLSLIHISEPTRL